MSNSLANRLVIGLSRAYGAISTLPFRFISKKVPAPKKISHSLCVDFLSREFDKKGFHVLEIGSRVVTGANVKPHFSNAEYIGFDFYPGQNVDIVGDVHRLSSYFKKHHKFDLIFSFAVFEHLYMPWVAATEIQKMLKVGGCVFVETHFSFKSHERPWHFFQFSDMGLRALFNDSLGFDLIDSGMSNPISGYFGHDADVYLKYRPITELYCHSEILCRKRCEVNSFDWNKVAIEGIAEGTRYPAPKQ